MHAIRMPFPCMHTAGSGRQHVSKAAIQSSGQYLGLVKVSLTRQNHETRCFLQTLTPLQGARLLVKSFPWYPDIPAVCIWISALAGNTAAITELRRLLPDETIEPANC